MKKILITEEMHDSFLTGLTSLGYSCNYQPGISQQDVFNTIGTYDGIVVATRIFVDSSMIDRAKQLLFIARAGSGMENIDVPFAETRKIVCINSPEGNANSVGEHCIGLLIALFHNITKSFIETSAGKWFVQQNIVHELEGRTIALIGYGNTGRSFARKLKPFGMRVLAYDKFLTNYGDEFASAVSMEDIFNDAEILSLHIPLTNETKWMVDNAYLNQFRNTLTLINTSRGKIINHADLLSSIYTGKVQQAALDVFENENFPEHNATEKETFRSLIDTGKVLFTPHIAGKSFESKKRISEVLIEKISLIS